MSFTENLTASLSALSQAQAKDNVAYAVASKTLDAQRNVGHAIGELLEGNAQLSKQAGLGVRFDNIG